MSGSNGTQSRTTRIIPVMQRKTSVEEVGDRIIGMLDEIERRVESLRDAANNMESEKEQLMEMLNTLNVNKEMLRLGDGERQDLEATISRLSLRCRTVEVQVSTPRNPEQKKALAAVNENIEDLLHRLTSNIERNKQTLQSWINACDPDQPAPIDQKFQSAVIGCTAEDQKKIRRRLHGLKLNLERAQQAVTPNT